MKRSPSNKTKNLSKTTSTLDSGGCFSLVTNPIMTIMIMVIFLILIFGKTTLPPPVDAQVSEIEQSLGELSRIFTPEVLYWERDINRWGLEWGLDPNMVATVMQIESCGSPMVKSPAGAIGLFQVMPFHFETTDQPYSPETNAQRGLAYLRQAMDTFENPRLAFAGYNGGITNAGRLETYWPGETVRYTKWGINIYNDAVTGKDYSPALEEWLAYGGINLCSEAHEHLGLYR